MISELLGHSNNYLAIFFEGVGIGATITLFVYIVTGNNK
jgi:hypothetical protein